MAGMRVDLKGLFNNIKAEIPRSQRAYYAFALDEVYKHIAELVAGQHTLEDFATHYCVKPAADKLESV